MSFLEKYIVSPNRSIFKLNSIYFVELFTIVFINTTKCNLKSILIVSNIYKDVNCNYYAWTVLIGIIYKNVIN